MHIALILSGSGVFDGAEIHETVLSLLAIEEAGHTWQAYAPDTPQLHVINHITGEEMSEQRNVLIESARITRGKIEPLHALDVAKVDALFLPGGFGAAKNLTDWAIKGLESNIHQELKTHIQQAWKLGKPLVALCMAPVVLGKALEGIPEAKLKLSVGTQSAPSPYDIAGIHQGLESLGMASEEVNNPQVSIDRKNKVVTGPCYMMEAGITDILATARAAVKAMETLS